MPPDTELETWRRQWQSQEAVTLDLRRRVESEIRRQRWGWVASWVVTIAFGIGVPAWAVLSRRADVVALAAAVWVFIAIAWAMALALGKGLSAPPPSTTTAAFLDFSISSCRRRRTAIVAGSVLYIAMLTFQLAWRYQARAVTPGVWAFMTSPRVVIIFAVTAVLAALAFSYRRRVGQELQQLLDLQRQLGAGDKRLG